MLKRRPFLKCLLRRIEHLSVQFLGHVKMMQFCNLARRANEINRFARTLRGHVQKQLALVICAFCTVMTAFRRSEILLL